jgi:peroxiredoxin
VAEAARMKRRLGLRMIVLSDADLAVTDRFGLRHQNGITATPRRGIFRPLAIPTTFLVDAGGRVRWIDRAQDYRVRSDAPRVLAAARSALA